MNLFDLHCDTATELFHRNLSFDNAVTHINKTSVQGVRLTQCFAVFFNDTKEVPLGMDFLKSVVKTTFPQLKQDNVTPILTVEGGGVLAKEPNWIDELSALRCRMVGLVWNGKNPLATGAVTDDKAPLTPLGREAVLELIAREIAVDVSHLSAAGTEEILTLTDAPIVASHSNAKAILPHPRNLSDSVAREIFARGGLVGLNLYPNFLAENGAEIRDVLRHAQHFLALGGEQGLCLGCDLDGIDRLPETMTDFSSLSLLYDAFLKTFGTEIADNVFYRNASRFFA
ncbi:MAG: dipeptidase [Clostridia bacterium]|nr:dipeptidase [Clostridia bacterium]